MSKTTEPSPPNPAAGGSYVLDPKTGGLRRADPETGKPLSKAAAAEEAARLDATPAPEEPRR